MKKKAIMVLALAAAMTMSACGANNGGTEGETTSANESSAEEKTTAGTEAEKETEETTTEATTAAEPENELFAYYKPLSEEYEKYKDKKVTGYYTFHGFIDDDDLLLLIAEYNNVLYFQDVSDYDFKLHHDIYSYNIDTKEYKKLLDLDSIEFPNGPANADSYNWNLNGIYFLDGYLYVNFDTASTPFSYDTLYDYNCYKMDLEGNIVQSVSCDQILFPSLNPDGSIIWWGQNSDDENADATGYVLSRVSQDFKTTTAIKAPETEAEHGIMEKIRINTLGADSDGNLYCTNNDSDKKLFYMKKGTDEWVDLGEVGFPFANIAGKYWINEHKIIDMENGGEVIAESSIEWYSNQGFSVTNNYFCGDGNMMLHDGAWYKVQIPSDGSNIDFSQYEPMGKESRDDYNIIPVNDTYYLYHDDYGYFLHTYEKGEEEEETVTLFEK